MYRYGFSATVGVVETVVSGGLGKLCPGTPVSPTKTMFQLEPVQLPKLSLRVRNCCWLPELTCPVTLESLMNPPLDQPPLSSRTTLPLMLTRRSGAACETAHLVEPEDGLRVRFSASRQKFCVALPPNHCASVYSPVPVIVVCVGDWPRPSTWV